MDPLHLKTLTDRCARHDDIDLFYRQNGCEFLHVLKRLFRAKQASTKTFTKTRPALIS